MAHRLILLLICCLCFVGVVGIFVQNTNDMLAYEPIWQLGVLTDRVRGLAVPIAVLAVGNLICLLILTFVWPRRNR